MLRRLTKDTVAYGTGQALGRAAQVLLVPILTRALAPGAYAISDLVAAYSQTVVLVLILGMDGALARFFYGSNQRVDRIRMISTSLVFRMIVATLASLALLALAGPLARWGLGGDAYRKYVLIGALTLPWTLFSLFCNDILRVTFQPRKFVALNLTQTTLVAGLSIWFVVVRHAGVVGVLYARLIADASTATLGFVMLRHVIRPVWDGAWLRRMLRYGIPMVPGAFAYGWLGSCDRFVLQKTGTLDQVAIYAVAMKFFSLLSMTVAGFQLAYGPLAFARSEQPDARLQYARVLNLFAAIASGIALAVALFAAPILAVAVPAAYRTAAGPAAWLAFASVALGVYSVLSVGVALSLQTVLLAWTAITAAAIGTAAQWLLTPRYGPNGAAIATFIGHAVSAGLAYLAAQRVYPIPYDVRRAGGLFLLALALGVLVPPVLPPGIRGVAERLIVLLLYGGVAARLVWRDVQGPRGHVSADATGMV
jgi:O-antigen/teichoic acid export membrane protein